MKRKSTVSLFVLTLLLVLTAISQAEAANVIRLKVGETANVTTSDGFTSHPPIATVERVYVWYTGSDSVASVTTNDSPYATITAKSNGTATISNKQILTYQYMMGTRIFHTSEQASGDTWTVIVGEEIPTPDPGNKCGDNVTYTIDNSGTLTISGTGPMYDYGYYQIADRSPFYGNSSIRSVIIKNDVTSIGKYAFYNCSGLRSVTIPNSVTSLEKGAFSNCSSLTSVTIPNSVTSIDEEVFYRCSSLMSVTIPNSVTSLEKGAFSGCSSLTSVTIPNSVTDIGKYAFSDCCSLTSVTIPNSVTDIGWGAFSDCSSLTSVTIPKSVTSISERAFSDCTNLTSVTIPDRVTYIGNYAFDNCSSLTSVTIPNNVTRIGNGAFFRCDSLKDVYYTGTEEQWKKIYIDYFNDDLTNAAIHYNSVPEPEFEIETIADNVAVDKEIENGKLTLTVTSETRDLNGVQMFVALFDDDVLQYIEQVKKDFSANSVSFTAALPWSDYKIYLWDEKQEPLIKSVYVE